MQVFTVDKSFGELTINSLSMHTNAWLVRDIRPLMYPQNFRGGNVTIPGVAGQRAYPYRVDAATHQLDMWITGDCDKTGTPSADPLTGMLANLSELTAALLTPPTPPTATLTASIALPDLSTVDADVQVLGFRITGHSFRADDAILTLRIPDGYFS